MKKAFKIALLTSLIILFSLSPTSSTSMTKNRQLGDANFGTHIAPLMTAVVYTQGPILEMGAGDFSTPLLHAICSATKRLLFTLDTDRKRLELFHDLATPWHQLQYVPVYEDDWQLNPKPSKWDEIGEKEHWAVVFVDHRPGERRIVDIQRLRSHTDVFVIHDTQEPGYGYEPILSSFKYRYVYDRYSTTTTLVSDTIDVTKFFEIFPDINGVKYEQYKQNFVLSPDKRNEWQWVDDKGMVYPWFTKPFLDILKNWDLHDWDIFEWGTGYSTIWFAHRCKSITSVDDKKSWIDAVNGDLIKWNLKNVTLKLRVPGSGDIGTCSDTNSPYVLAIDEDNRKYDCIIIDGDFCRNSCAKNILNHIKPDGIIILDNANQASVGLDSTPTFDILKKYPHFSYKQPNHRDWRTDYWIIAE